MTRSPRRPRSSSTTTLGLVEIVDPVLDIPTHGDRPVASRRRHRLRPRPPASSMSGSQNAAIASRPPWGNAGAPGVPLPRSLATSPAQYPLPRRRDPVGVGTRCCTSSAIPAGRWPLRVRPLLTAEPWDGDPSNRAPSAWAPKHAMSYCETAWQQGRGRIRVSLAHESRPCRRPSAQRPEKSRFRVTAALARDLLEFARRVTASPVFPHGDQPARRMGDKR